ncbi:MAG: hypothetical protein ACRDGF_08525 [Chloroflexota bacterium]
MPRTRSKAKRPGPAAAPRRLGRYGKWAAILPLLALLIATLIGLFGNSLVPTPATGSSGQQTTQQAYP